MKWYLCHGIPVGLGVFLNGVDFSSVSSGGSRFKKNFSTGKHALVLTSVKNFTNENGQLEEYFVLRDSGYYDGSRFARFPVRESCRIINAFVLLSKRDQAEISHSDLPPRLNSAPPIISSSEKIAEFVSDQRLTCSSIEGCPGGLAKLISFHRDENYILSANTYPNRCNGFLVSPELLVTNSHCIPADLRQAGSSCDGRIFAVFQNEKLGCREITYTSPAEFDSLNTSADIAFVRLQESSKNKPLQIKRLPLENNQQVVVHSTSQFGNSSKIEKQVCTIAYENYVLPVFDNPQNPRLTLGRCKILGGDSGSPVIDPQTGDVVAVIDGSTLSEDFNSIINLWKERGLLLESIEPMATATNFTCVNLPDESDHALPSACYKGFGRRQISQVRKDIIYQSKQIKNTTAEMEREFDKYTSKFGSNIDWTEVILSQLSEYSDIQIPFPKCIKEKIAVLDLPAMPQWKFTVGFNQYFQFFRPK